MDFEKIDIYLNGQKLYGDDFSPDEIRKWFEDEKEASAHLIIKKINKYGYHRHLLNYKHGFRFLPDKSFSHVLGFGSAYGHDIKPIIHRSEKVTIIDSSNIMYSKKINNIPINYIRARYDGVIPFPVIHRLDRFMKKQDYNSEFILFLDRILCAIFAWNTKYNRSGISRLGPKAIFYVLKKE